MVGQTGAVDAKDSVTSTSVLSGENSGIPTLQARVNLATRSLEFALWVHHAEEETEAAIAGETDFTSSLVGMDFFVSVYEDKVWVHGEYWKGENLSDVRGGIAQGVHPTSGVEIESKGGWIEIGLKVSEVYSVTIGYSTDDPKDSDLGAAAVAAPAGFSSAYATSGASKNKILFTSHTLNFKPVVIGFELLSWDTQYVGSIGDGDALRFKAYIAYIF